MKTVRNIRSFPIVVTASVIILVAIAAIIWKVGNNEGTPSQHDNGISRDENANVKTTRSADRERNPTGKTRRAGKINDLKEAEALLAEVDLMPLLGDKSSEMTLHRINSRIKSIDPSLYPALLKDMAPSLDEDWQKLLSHMVILREWSRIDWDAAMSYCSNMATPRLREVAYSHTFSALAEESPEKAITAAEKLVTSLSEKDLEFSPTGTFRPKQIIKSVYKTWLKSDPVSALGWADTLAPGKDKNQKLEDGVVEWAKMNRNAALERADAIADVGARSRIYGIIAGDLIMQDPVEAKKWIDGLPEGAPKETALKWYTNSQSGQ